MAVRDQQIDYIISKLENKEHGKAVVEGDSYQDKANNGLKEESSQIHEEKGKAVVHGEDSQRATSSGVTESLPAKTLRDMIKDVSKEQLDISSSAPAAYHKTYSQRIEALVMPSNYQPPFFQSFNGKWNPRQHVAHFVETCNNAGTSGDLMVKQFIRSLKGNAFDWYIDLKAGSIDSWEQLEREFVHRFYSTKRAVSMVELNVGTPNFPKEIIQRI